jgi:hypothetical protein
MVTTQDPLVQSTRSSFLWSRILNVPFFAVLNLLPLILYKELQISALQIAAYVALKPISALLASYWSVSIHKRQDRLNGNVLWANVLRYLPFLFFPWVDSAWFMILASGSYMTLNRGGMPAWMEIFKRNIKGISREQVFAFGSILDYLGPAVLTLGMGLVLDDFHSSWRWLFFGTAVLGLSSTFFLYRLPKIPLKHTGEPLPEITWREKIAQPWKQSWELVQKRPDFARFQIGFMFGGAGLMVMAATLTFFFVDVLHLSYTEIALAIALCKGAGVAASSQLWVRLFHRMDIFHFCALVTLLAALFPFFLLSAQWHTFMLYAAYLLYGVMQGGSELGWHMSGPVFAHEEESSLYTQTNVLTVGLRGCIAPFFGSLLYTVSSSSVALMIGSALCVIATERMVRYGRSLAKELPESP